MKYDVIVGKPKIKENNDRERMLARGKERNNLIEIIKSEGFDVLTVNTPWPRDAFVNFKEKIIRADENGFYGNSAVVVPSGDFVIASSKVGNYRVNDSTSLRTQKLTELYGPKNFHVISDGYNGNVIRRKNRIEVSRDDIVTHLDLSILSVPEKKLLVCDNIFYKNTNEDIDKLVKKRGLKLKLVEDTELRHFPCNALLLKKQNSIVAITGVNNFEPSLISPILEDVGIRTIEVPFTENLKKDGGVACATNILPKNYNGGLDFLNHRIAELY